MIRSSAAVLSLKRTKTMMLMACTSGPCRLLHRQRNSLRHCPLYYLPRSPVVAPARKISVVTTHARTALKNTLAQRGAPCQKSSLASVASFARASFTAATATASSAQRQRRSSSRRWVPAVLATSALVGGGITYYLHDHLGGTEGLWRTLSFYSLAIPKYVVYRYHAWRQSPDHVWEALDKETSQQGLVKILELEGFYVKCGQLCASNFGDAFPRVWQDTMSVLQDQVPPQDFAVIKSIVESELDFDATFASFDPIPIGAASIGQVHRAVLKDGTRVVVKVCYPNVERLLRGDVRTIKLFARLAQPVHVPALEETERQFQTEFDYRQEAANLARVRDNLMRAGLAGPGKLCQVPQPYLDLCTKRVLVMEELRGPKLQVALRHDAEHHAARAGTTVDQYVEAQRERANALEEQGKAVPSPTRQQYDLFISLVDQKRRLRNAWNRWHNLTLGLLPGAETRPYLDKSVLPLNHAQLVDDLFAVHGHEVLVDGFFNGDPHPGNILLCRLPDGTPQIGLIDYGQTKSLTKEQRHLFAKLIIALDNDDKDEIVRLMKEAGFKSERMDPDVMYAYAKVGYDKECKELTQGKHMQVFMEDLQARDPIIELPKDYLMVSRASLMIRGLAHALHQSRSTATEWRPIAERVLREDL